MDENELWDAIDAQRLAVAGLLDSLAPSEWDQPSLCDGWTVRDVAAHLTLQQLGWRDVVAGVLRHPGGLNHVIHETARDRAGLPTDRIVTEIRGMIGSRRHNVGVTPRETLVDIVVHGQDIAVPLGRTLDVPPRVAAAAAQRVWSFRASWVGRRTAGVFRPVPATQFRLTATDAPWSVGSGPEVSGPALALLLLLTGRAALLPQLSGEGLAALAARVGGAAR